MKLEPLCLLTTTNNLELHNEEKYLKLNVFYKHPLIKDRFSGRQVLFSDISFFKKIHNEDLTYREIASRINHDPSSVYYATKMLERINTS